MLNSTPKILLSLSTALLLISLFLSSLNSSYIMEWEICYMLSNNFNLNMLMEWSGMLYCSTIMFISSMVMKFSKNYMKADKNKIRFWVLVLLFITSMMLLIMIPNMMTLLLGWDGLGITSFILIIYYNNPQSMSAGMFTMLTNRLGDTFLLMAIIASLNNSNWLPLEPPILIHTTTTQSLGIMIAAMTKSAQLPYSSWLPAAMAAPTPVSALVHSSTLVTAGIFLLYRFNNLICSSTLLQSIISMSGLLTMFMASLSAMYEKDMKKIIALSTLSQLGLMTLCLGLKMFNLMFFHMVTHAIFKALLFICAGTLISMNSHNQDTRLYGSYLFLSPSVASSLFISSMTMIGLPFMIGYYSKHTILEWSTMNYLNITIYLLLMTSIMLTSMYSIQLILSITTKPTLHNTMSPHNSSNDNTNPTTFMSIMSICLAPMLQWSLPLTTNLPQMTENFQSITINLLLMMSLMLALFLKMHPLKKIHMLNKFFSTLSFMTPLSTKLIIPLYLNLSFYLYKLLDQTWLEKMSSMSTLPLLMKPSHTMNKLLTHLPNKNLLMSSTMILMLSIFCSL